MYIIKKNNFPLHQTYRSSHLDNKEKQLFTTSNLQIKSFRQSCQKVDHYRWARTWNPTRTPTISHSIWRVKFIETCFKFTSTTLYWASVHWEDTLLLVYGFPLWNSDGPQTVSGLYWDSLNSFLMNRDPVYSCFYMVVLLHQVHLLMLGTLVWYPIS